MPAGGLVFHPIASHGLKGVRGLVHLLGFFGLAHLARIAPQLQGIACEVGQLAGVLQAHARIDTKGKPLFFATMAVLQAPVLAACLADFDIKPRAIKMFAGFGFVPDLRIGKWHGRGILQSLGAELGAFSATAKQRARIHAV